MNSKKARDDAQKLLDQRQAATAYSSKQTAKHRQNSSRAMTSPPSPPTDYWSWDYINQPAFDTDRPGPAVVERYSHLEKLETMSAPEVHHLFHHPIADHSFSADREILAVARDNNVELYKRSGSKFALKDELKGHEKTVTGVDIAPSTGRIVTCSQDRNAYVWEPSPTGWKPTLVLLRINRAATFVRWSPSEKKFAVGSGARVIAVCYFEEENDWWVSKQLKKPIRSTITTVAWHPNSVLLAAGSTDAHARVFSSFIKGVDERPEASVWGERLPFNTVCGEYLNNSAGWVHGCAFSPSGNVLAFTAHDSSVTVVYPSGPDQPPSAVVSLSTQLLPFLSLIWNGEDEIIAAGYVRILCDHNTPNSAPLNPLSSYRNPESKARMLTSPFLSLIQDCEAYRLQGTEQGWQIVGSLESKSRPGALGGEAREESALHMFRQMDLKGKTQNDTQLKTVHQNTVQTIREFESLGEGKVRKFSSMSFPP